MKKKTSKEKKEKENQKRLEAFRNRDKKIHEKTQRNRARQHRRREGERLRAMNYLDMLEDRGVPIADKSRITFINGSVSQGGKKGT